MAVTTSTAVVGVAIAKDDRVLSHEQVVTDRRHAEELTPMIQRQLGAAQVDLCDMTRFVVDIGPGRFTGMRVGLATVKSLSFATGKPIVPVTSFEMLWRAHPGPLTAVIDARRNEVFVRSRSASGEISQPEVLLPAELSDRLKKSGSDTILLGDGADRYRDMFGTQRVLVNQHPNCAAAACGPSDLTAFGPDEIHPMYLRDADVKINIKTRHTA